MKQQRGELTHVASLFEKYKQLLKPPQQTVQNAMVEIIKDVTGHTLHQGTVLYTVSTRTITLKVSSILKQEILLHQSELLLHARGRLGEKNAPTVIR
jgi:ATP-dependent protease HslVU (ClpYQ) peptidase subunit